MDLKIYLVDAFSLGLGTGNPAGVVMAPQPMVAEQMQSIAFEINYSETSFITRIDKQHYDIRWFTPKNEVPLCGHATMAAAKVIFNQIPDLKIIHFTYRGGTLRATQQQDGRIAITFPLDNYRSIPIREEYLSFFGLNQAVDCILGVKTQKVVLILAPDAVLEQIHPDYQQMVTYQGMGDRGIGISKLSESYDFESRYFNPWYGVNEDPVTGTVHTILAGYWAEKLGKRNLSTIQKSQRSGELMLHITDENTVEISGQVNIFLEGVIHISN